VGALQGLTLAHGGTAGLIVELSTAIVVAAFLVWAAVRSRRDPGEGDE
jgi:uncharacterized membrane protein